MAWVNISGRRYYRRSKRVGGRVVTEHIGGGEIGELMAMVDDSERIDRRIEADLKRADRDGFALRVRDVFGIERFLADLFGVLANGCGFHQHRRQWRRTRRADPMGLDRKTPLKKLGEQLGRAEPRRPLVELAFDGIPEADRETLRAAAGGDRAALARAQPYLTDPEFIKRWGNPMYAARCWLVSQVAGDDTVQDKLTHGRVRQLQGELGFDAANTLERIAITRVVHNWLAVAALESKACQAGFEGRERAQIEKCLTQAERRLMQAVKALAFLRDCSVASLMSRIGDVTNAEPRSLDK